MNDAGEYFRFTEGTWGVVAKVLGGGTSINGGLFFELPHSWFNEYMPAVNYSAMESSANTVAAELAVPSEPTPFGLEWN